MPNKDIHRNNPINDSQSSKKVHFFIVQTFVSKPADIHPVSVVVVVVDVNFFSFSTSSLKPHHGFASNFVMMFLG